MSDSDRKNKKKMISLRLSEVEYEVLKAQYRTYGARNVSDLARLALRRVVNGSATVQDCVENRLADLLCRVQALESMIAIIARRAPPDE